MKTQHELVPPHKEGGRTGASAKEDAETRHDAIILFNEAKRRLLDINHWHKLVGKSSAIFQLTDSQGNPLNAKEPEVGNLIRIQLPAPPNKQGDGYDWVRIEKFESQKIFLKDEEVFGFRVRPVQNPGTNSDRNSAHFYTSDATSTFIVVRNANTVMAMERGRNEKPNTGARSLFNKIRNSVIAVAAMAGLANPQWKGLVNGLLKGPPQD
jgi:hypothetical protein